MSDIGFDQFQAILARHNIQYIATKGQIFHVLSLLGRKRVERGIDAFEQGAPTWNGCFFAFALGEPTSLEHLCKILGKEHENTIRAIVCAFDGRNAQYSNWQLRKVIHEWLDYQRPAAVVALFQELESPSIDLRAERVRSNQPLPHFVIRPYFSVSDA